MKKFCYKCFLFAVVTLLAAVGLQQIVDYGLKRMNSHSATQTSVAELLSDTLNADIVVVGNSRALCSYNTEVMERLVGKRVWNIGVNGQPFGISYMRYQLYAMHNKKPQLIIVNIVLKVPWNIKSFILSILVLVLERIKKKHDIENNSILVNQSSLKNNSNDTILS